MDLIVTRLTNKSFLRRNIATFNGETYDGLCTMAKVNSSSPDTQLFVQVGEAVYSAKRDDDISAGAIGIGVFERDQQKASINQSLRVRPFELTNSIVSSITCNVTTEKGSDKRKAFNIDTKELRDTILKTYNQTAFAMNQKFQVKYNEIRLILEVASIESTSIMKYLDAQAPSDSKSLNIGQLTLETSFLFEKAPDCQFKIIGSGSGVSELFKDGFSLKDLGIGGLGDQFASIFRRAFASRIFPPAVIKSLGLQHVKGILLYGPPGCGKTLMARQIGKMLNSREPKIVNGPEIMNKYVGQSEENIRALFKDAEEDYKENGDFADLHIIIFDEIDAICKQRGMTSDSTGVQDSVVNQLLSLMDGVDVINNILVIGMTNRKDLIDDALMRPGRFELCIEIHLPDRAGIEEIYKIHMKHMFEAKMLKDVTIEEPDKDKSEKEKIIAYSHFQDIVTASKNYSGAEIAGVCRCAASYALNRNVRIDDGKVTVEGKNDDILVTFDDFMAAIKENPPAFGKAEKFHIGGPLSTALPGMGLEANLHSADRIIRYASMMMPNKIANVLVVGSRGNGKSSIASYIAEKVTKEDGFMRLLSTSQFIERGALSEARKAERVIRTFQDSLRVREGSSASVIIIDDLDRLVEYTRMGMRYSNVIVQALRGSLELTSSADNVAAPRLVIATLDTSVEEDISMLGLLDLFQFRIDLRDPDVGEKFSVLRETLGDKFPSELEGKQELFKEQLASLSLKQLMLAADSLLLSSEALTQKVIEDTLALGL